MTLSMFPLVEPTRRRFLTVAAGAGAASIAAAAVASPPSLPQAVALPRLASEDISPALRYAIHALAGAYGALVVAQAANEEAEAAWQEWENDHPQPASRRGRRRWIRHADAKRQAIVAQPWQDLMRAELLFAGAQIDVARVPMASLADLRAMAACARTYDGVELARVNRAPIARVVAQEVLGRKAVQS